MYYENVIVRRKHVISLVKTKWRYLLLYVLVLPPQV